MVALIPTSRGRIAVREWRTRVRGGNPLLLIHGFMGSGESWGDTPGQLVSDFHVAAVDLPGHGDSDPWSEPYEIPEVARVLAEVQRKVFGAPAWWLGYSMGGRIALSAAVQDMGLLGLLAEGGSPGLADFEARMERVELDEDRAADLEARGLPAFVDDWLRLPLFKGLHDAPPHVLERARQIRVRQGQADMARWLREGGTGRQPSYWEELEAVRIPVRLLVGSRDRKFVDIGQRMAARLPDVTLSYADGAGHTVHLEAPSAWVQWIQQATGTATPT